MDDLAKAALADGIYVAYTEGSCKPNPGPGGCAMRLHYAGAEPVQRTCYDLSTTCNKAAMRPVIDALTVIPEGAQVQVWLNSGYVKSNAEKYLAGWQRNNWKKSGGGNVANREQWEIIADLMGTRKVVFHMVKANSGDAESELVNKLAGEMADKAGRRAFCALRDAN